MRTPGLGTLAVVAAGFVAVAGGCTEGGTATDAPTLPPILTTTTVPASTTLNLVDQRRFYTVETGDNLTRIAARFGVAVEELMAKNGIRNPDAISVGQVLELPESAVLATTTVAPSAPTTTSAP